MVIQMNTSL